MLILTEACNLNCTYCYEHRKNHKMMSFETAKSILDISLAELGPNDSAVIELHGGEPFLNFDLIRQIDEYVLSAFPGLSVLFRSTTNGTLVHGEVQDWLRERKDRYSIMLSLDGKRAQHDANRRLIGGQGSFDHIDRNFFTDTWPYCPVSMTVNSATLPMLAEGTQWIQEQGFDCLNAFEWAVDWNMETCLPVLQRELDKLVAYYSERPDRHMCLLVNYDLEKFFLPLDDTYRYCVEIDEPVACYNTDGTYAPCHGFTYFTLGDQAKVDRYARCSICDFAYTEESICRGCRLARLCRTCFAANYLLTGNMQLQSKEICMFNRMCIEAGIRIQRARLAAAGGESAEEGRSLLDAADAVEAYLRTAFPSNQSGGMLP